VACRPQLSSLSTDRAVATMAKLLPDQQLVGDTGADTPGIVFAEPACARPRVPRRPMDPQRTLRRQISCVGIGLHSGNKVTLSLKPAQAGSGIRFRRTDIGDHEVPARVSHLAGIQLATGLAREQVSVETVEHLLAALVSVGVDNVIIELNSPEVPIMDGSAAPFIYLIQEAGVKRLAAA